MSNDEAYDQAVDNFLTGDIHLIPDSFLFDMIAKHWVPEEADAVEVNRRWIAYQNQPKVASHSNNPF